jgi:TonB family protein
MDILTLPNLLAYSLQVAAIVLLATIAVAILRVDVPGVRYAIWRVVLALCLVLPFIQGRQLPEAAASANATVETTLSPTVLPASAGEGMPFDWGGAALPVIAAGVIARLGWLALSFGRLQRLRRRGERAEACRAHDDLQELIGVRCEVHFVDRLRQPVTFGVRRPVILLPAALADASDEVQRAVISHELFHVKRRDWAWLVGEELICALLWFNPAVWWAVSRVHDARELVVDELAVLATGRRRAYVEALMRFADETSLAPVAAFGGRRQLFHRIVMLSKERVMSSRRIVLTVGVMTLALAAGAGKAMSAFPLTSEPQLIRQTTPGPLEQRAVPVTPENPIPRRVNQQDAEYPAEAQMIGARGQVALMITLDEIGRVVEARRISLRVSTSEPSATIAFSMPNAGEQKFVLNNDIDFSNKMKAAAEAFETASIRAVEQWRYDPPAAAPISFVVSFTFSPTGTSAAQGSLAMSGGRGGGAASSMQAGDAVRVGGTIATPTKIVHVDPIYPAIALQAKVRGVVIAEVRIGTDGSVEDAKVLRSIPLLDEAALDAVRQWRFTPTLLNGQAVPVMMTVTVNFTPQSAGGQPSPAPIEMATQVSPPKPMPRLIREVKPMYPREGFKTNASGLVEVAAVVGTDGTVTAARILRSVPIFDQAALDAVYQWEFAPIERPVEVNIELTFAARSNR